MFPRVTKPKPGMMSKGLVFFLYLFLIFPAISLAADKTPPTASININSYASYATTASVTISISAKDKGSGMGKGAKMRFSNDNYNLSRPDKLQTF